MIMSIIGFENKIIFKSEKINVLEIYDKKLFANFIGYINEQCNGEGEEDNRIVLMNDSKRQKIGKNIFLLTDLFNIDFNSKKILNKIYAVIEQNIKNRQDDEINKIILSLRKYLIDEINEIPFEFNMNSDIDVQDLLKIFNVKIDTSCYISIVEKIEFIIDIISNFKIAEILVIPNLKTYLNEYELLEIYKYSIYNNVNLLLVENVLENKLLKYEQKNIIDENFDEMIEIYKSMNLENKREVLVNELKEFLVIMSKLNEINDADNSILYNKALYNDLKNATEEEYLTTVYAYFNAIKESFSLVGDMIIE